MCTDRRVRSKKVISLASSRPHRAISPSTALLSIVHRGDFGDAPNRVDTAADHRPGTPEVAFTTGAADGIVCSAQIYRDIKAHDLTQVQAGEILGIKQPHVSLLMRNRSGNFSVERLMDFLTALGHDVEIRVTRTRKPHGQMSVVVAA